MIRGKKVDKALRGADLLAEAHRRPGEKDARIAIANAENNHGLELDNLVVAEA